METLERMDAFFENRLAGYDEHMRTAIEGAAEFYAFTAKQLPVEPGCEILDLGCGTGLELEAYFPRNPRARITGIDLSSAMLRALEQKFPGKQLELIHGSYFDVPFGERRYSAALSVESLHHFTEGQKLFLYRKLHGSLKEDGFFILTDYFAQSREEEAAFFSALERQKREQQITDGAFYHFDTPLTPEHEMAVLQQAGFSDVRILGSWGPTHTIKAAY